MVRALAPWHDPTASVSIQANAVSSGLYFNCALTTYAGIRCWGYNVYGQLGDGTEERRTSPVDVVELSSGVANFDAGNSHTCEHYEVYRSATAPYCEPGGPDSVKLPLEPLAPPDTATEVTFTDTGALALPDTSYFYAVVPVSYGEEPYATSNRTGAYSYGLIPGSGTHSIR